MAASYKNLGLFSSGPCRFMVGKQGILTLPAYITGGSGAGSVIVGTLELEVIVTGRLVASSEAVLWQLRDALTSQLTNPPVPGTLIDHHGRSWENVSLVTIQWAEQTDRGRLHSIEYKCVFRLLTT